jgi:hypothetical protein
LNAWIASLHVPPFSQGFGLQSSTLVAHSVPEKPVAHVQLKPLTASMQAPPF